MRGHGHVGERDSRFGKVVRGMDVRARQVIGGMRGDDGIVGHEKSMARKVERSQGSRVDGAHA